VIFEELAHTRTRESSIIDEIEQARREQGEARELTRKLIKRRKNLRQKLRRSNKDGYDLSLQESQSQLDEQEQKKQAAKAKLEAREADLEEVQKQIKALEKERLDQYQVYAQGCKKDAQEDLDTHKAEDPDIKACNLEGVQKLERINTWYPEHLRDLGQAFRITEEEFCKYGLLRELPGPGPSGSVLPVSR
jgi:seryl-tRNA synthetase